MGCGRLSKPAVKANSRTDTDTLLQMRTRTCRAISTIGAGGLAVRSLSMDSLKEVTASLMEMNQDVVKLILDCKEERIRHLFDMVELYFDITRRTLDCCAALQSCLERPRDTGHIVLPFSLHHAESFRLLQSVYGQQLSMLEELQLRKARLDKRLRTLRRWRKLSAIVFAAACTAAVVCSVVAAAVAAPPVAAVLGAATSIPIGSMGKWLDSVLKGHEDPLRGQKDVIGSMQAGTFVAIKDLDSIRATIDRLQLQLGSMVKSRSIQAEFVKGVEELAEHAVRCTRDITRARMVVLQHITGHLD